MKTKTLLLSLLAGAFLCFSNASYAQYHSSSSSSSSSSGDGVIDEGSNIFGLGIGFAGGLAGDLSLVNATSTAGGVSYSGSTSPGIRVDWEHGKNEHIAYGIILQYQSANWNDGSQTGYNYNYSTGAVTPYTYTDTWKVTLITFAGRFNYHFSAGSNFDPYIGLTLGYVTGSFTYSTTDVNNQSALSVSGTGLGLGAHVGARYLFSSHIGAFVEFAYCTNDGENYANLGLSFKL